MPKRKRKHNDYDEIRRKIKKLERDLHHVRDTRSAESRDERDRYYEYSDRSDENSIRHESENSLDGDIYGDFPEYPPEEDPVEIIEPDAPTRAVVGNAAPIATPTAGPAARPINTPTTTSTVTSTVTTAATHTAAHVTCPAVATDALCAVSTGAEVLQKESPTALDSSVLEILGEDPSESIQYGSEIRKELANRLEHIATTGLSKEVRKELLEAYLIPANCTKIGAPLMNAEIKAAVTDVITKRDKGIEMRQKQLACAISGLAGVINTELESSEKNNERLKQLMDIGRILCDVQHSESVTRRNFAIYSIKKDLKDHITNTKIDKYLFGEELAETLKTAKAVSKSGTELKVKSQVRSVKPFTPTSNLNWRARAPARRQQGPQRNREPAHRSSTPGPSSRHTRTPRHSYSSKTSQPPQRQQRRR
ncbi:uncharacterized protein LOC134805789 [Cydia splendana]|uniref:uncharacterized protein LOC134805789 n=1 Tax=Cydia splendana TaxID=1100963 RepID=UPI00300D8BD3